MINMENNEGGLPVENGRLDPWGRRLLGLTLAGAVLFAWGCGNSDRKPVYPVHGQVLVDGQPAAEALVTFHPVRVGKDSPRAVGNVDAKGNFRLTTYTQGDGAPEGEYQVSVHWFLATPVPDAAGGEEHQTVNVLPARYADPGSSGLRVTVARGSNELPAFQLQSR
jgi:hypothetical protein